MMSDKKNIHLVSDSICCDYTNMKGFFPQAGWGQYISDYFNNDVNIVNHALAGYSLKAFLYFKYPYTESLKSVWDADIYPTIQSNDYVIISSDINDMGSISNDYYSDFDGNIYKFIPDENKYMLFVNGKPTNNCYMGETEKLTKVFSFASKLDADGKTENCEYKSCIKKMINEIRAKGAVPVLVSSPTEFLENETGLYSEYSKYIDAMKETALKEHITYIDLHTEVKKLYTDLGNENARLKYNVNQHTIEYWQKKYNHNTFDCSKKACDNTHFCIGGAQMLAKLLASLIKKSDSSLKEYIVNI